MKCISCGNLIPDASTLCPYCNAAVEPVGAFKPVYGDTLGGSNTPITPDLPVAQPGGIAVPQTSVAPVQEAVVEATPNMAMETPVTPEIPVQPVMTPQPLGVEIPVQPPMTPQPLGVEIPVQPPMTPQPLGVETPVQGMPAVVEQPQVVAPQTMEQQILPEQVVPGAPVEPININQGDVPVEASIPVIPEEAVQSVPQPVVAAPEQNIIVPTPAPTINMVSQGIEAPTTFGGEKIGTTAEQPKKKMSKGALIALIVFLVLVIAGVAGGVMYYNSQYNNANERLDAVVNGMFKSLLEVRNEELEVASGEYSFKASIKSNDETQSIGANGKYAFDTILGIADYTINVDSLYIGKELLDAGELNLEVYSENNRVYFLLQNFYEKYVYIDSETPIVADKEEDEPILDYQITVKALREATKRALRAASKEQTVKDITIGGVTTNANAITIKLNEKNKELMLKAFVNSLGNNAEFVKEVAKLTGKKEEEVKTLILSLIEEKEETTEEDTDDDYENLFVEPKKEENIVLEIYTAKFGEEFIGANISVKVVYDKNDEHYSEMYQDIDALIDIYEKEEALHIDLTSDEKKIFELSYGSVSEMNSDTEETITNFALTFRDEQDKASKIEVEFKVVADLQPKVGKVVVKNIISYDKVTQAEIDGIVNKIFNYGTFGKYVKNKYDEAQAQIPSEPSYDVNYGDDLLDSGDNELDLNNPTVEIG